MRKEGHSILSGLPWATKLVSVRVWLPCVSEFGSGARSPTKHDHFPMCPSFCAKHHAYILSVQFSCVRLFVTLWTATCQASLSITNSWSLLKLMSIASVMPSNHLILYHPHLLLPSIFPSIRIFPMSQFFASGGQSIGVSASASVLPMNIQDWAPLGLTGWISLQSKRLSRVFSNTTVQKTQFFSAQLSL